MREIKIWQMLLIWLVMPMVSLIVVFMVMDVFKMSEPSEVVSSFIIFAGLLLVIFAVGKVNKKLIRRTYEDAKRKINWKEILFIVVTQMLLSIGLSNLSVGLISLADESVALEMLNENLGTPTTMIQLILFLGTVVILAPILEEIVFRRVVFTRFSLRIGMWPAAILSSFIFGLGHIDLAILGAMVFGIICCLLYKKYQNIGIPMIMHAINNFIAGIATCVGYFSGGLNEVVTEITSSDIQSYLISGVILTAITAILSIRYVLKNKQYFKKTISY